MSRDLHDLKVGILGGGQLARMLALKGHEMGLAIHIMSESPSDPAALVCSRHFQGSMDNKEQLHTFIDEMDVVTFESEFLDSSLLEKAREGTKTDFFPQPKTMGVLQDRWSQKNLLETYKIPTAPFVNVELTPEFQPLHLRFPKGFVLKRRRFGYDGYGTFIVTTEKDWQIVYPTLRTEKTGFIAEELIEFKRELAVTYARSQKGQIVVYPLVESFQQNSQCLWVKGPTKNKHFAKVDRKIKRLLREIDYTGVIAFEFFEKSSGELLVNEVAPRVHNSSHYSLNGFNCDQFSLHLRAICGAHLPTPEALRPGFAMYNLLGSGSTKVRWDLPADVQLHWYAKLENRKGRKMGHINAQGSNPTQALSKLKKARKAFVL